MRRVRMLLSVPGSPDGIQVIYYEAGQAYEMPERLAGPWLERGWAEEDKMVQGAPERKEAVEAEEEPVRKARRK